MNERQSSTLLADPILTQAIGPAPTDETKRIGTQIAVPTRVFTSSFNIPIFGNAGARVQPRGKMKRARGGTFNKIEQIERSTRPGTIEEKGLKGSLDRRDRDDALASAGAMGAEAIFDLRKETADTTRSQVLNGKEKEIADTLQDPAKYAAQHSNEVAKLFAAGSRKFLSGLRDKIRQKSNARANALYVAKNIYDEIVDSTELKNQFTPTTSDTPSEDFVKKFFRVDHLFIGEDHYLDGDDVPVELWLNSAILFYHNPAQGLRAATFAKSFYRVFTSTGLPYYVSSKFDEAENEEMVYAEEYSPDGAEIVYPNAAWLLHT
ncbi:MAG TPA: hypothetical protein VF787_24520 [Thermoanaerobaculia bacterium]